MRRLLFLASLVAGSAWLAPDVTHAAGERINHEGRILGPLPVVSSATLFNTTQADAIVSAMQIMPVDSAWNEDVSRRPILANSDAMIARIMTDLGSSRQTLRAFYEMNYVLVPDAQPNVAINFYNYPDESDPSPYPIPSNLPIEQWPRGTGSLTLAQWQQNVNNDTGDRHAIMVKPGAGTIWETWLTQLTDSGWQASNGAKFDLTTNTLRPAGWTSGDAAGLPMFPALVRYDECERGMVEHAMRIVVKRSRVGPIYPATHQASVGNTTDPNVPAMGQRVRLKAGFVIPASWTTEEKAVLLALKKYGAIVADNGGFFSISVCPDDRFSATAFDHLSTVGISNFEVVQSTGATEGPRSAGAPTVDAGADLTAAANVAVTLNGRATSPAGAALTVNWKLYSGPGTVSFANPAQASTTVVFSTPGTYTLMLSATDQVHAVAYGALVVTVTTASTTWDAWRNANFTPAELADASVSGDAADPDHDGLSNLLEYATGRNPKVEDGSAPLVAQIITPTGGTRSLQLTFQRRKNLTDVTLALQSSAALATDLWTDQPLDAFDPSVTDIDSLTEQVTLKVPSPGVETGFYRLKATRQGGASVSSRPVPQESSFKSVN